MKPAARSNCWTIKGSVTPMAIIARAALPVRMEPALAIVGKVSGLRSEKTAASPTKAMRRPYL